MRISEFRLLMLFIFFGFGNIAMAGSSPLITHAEYTGFEETGRYEEVQSLCENFSERYPDHVRCEQYGLSTEGYPLLALIASSPSKSDDNPVAFFLAGLHAGEVAGKDGVFIALRDILTNSIDTLNDVTVVLVPVVNPDGHERFSENNRPNQVGPKAMGWRTNGINLDLNRDFAKVEAVETQFLMKLLNKWDPIVLTDIHSTDGAKFQHGISLLVRPSEVGTSPLRIAGKILKNELVDRLEQKGHKPIAYYPEFSDWDDPASGLIVYMDTPRYSYGYWSFRNRIGMLVENHSWKDYATRVASSKDAIIATVDAVRKNGRDWLVSAKRLDDENAAMAGEEFVLSHRTTGKSDDIDFLGYSYDRILSDISGQLWTVYDDTFPEVWTIPLYAEVVPDLVIDAPRVGYIVPRAYVAVVEPKLKYHNISYSRISTDWDESVLEMETFRSAKVEFGSSPKEGRMTASVEGKWAPEAISISKGSLFIPIEQSASRILLQIIEPTAPDSLVYWGFFNSVFESKEYMENYMLEVIAREMLANSPDVKAEFEQMIEDDPAFAEDPAARLDFFYKKHPSYDQRLGLYPVVRINKVP